MMKIQLIGTKDKTDFLLYLAHTITAQGKRVLIADSSKESRFYYGVATLEGDERLYDIHGIDVICNVHSLAEVEAKIKRSNEQLANYDFLLVDMDDISTLQQEWGTFDKSLYVSDSDRFNIHKDMTLLHWYLDHSKEKSMRRVHFQSAYDIPTGFIELKMNERISFTEDSFEIDYDEKIEELRIMLQHNHLIPYKNLNRSYKRMLTEIVSDWLGLIPNDVEKSAKPSLFSRFKKTQINKEG